MYYGDYDQLISVLDDARKQNHAISAEPCPFQGVFNMKSDNLRSKACLVYVTQLYATIYSGGGCIDGVFGEPDGL